ncbi:MAG: hypothetical protein ABJE95_02420 [Byssovorax sp.]
MTPPNWLDRLAARWPRIDGVVYPVFAALCTLYAALFFYGSLHRQTHGGWSAPLDDVFIHFDYARATARGYPFQWSEGNGFSSGNTSLSYPFALALGYWVGFRGLAIMHWAAIVACISCLGFFLAAGRLTAPLGRWAKYLIPPAVLSLGALDWSLFSGMENAFHLGVWGLSLIPVLRLVRETKLDPSPARDRRVAHLGWIAGLAGVLLYATRPESVVCIASFAIFAAIAVRRASGNRPAIRTVLRIGVPGAVAVVVQAVANHAFTGEWSANGAIAKLAINNPYLTGADKVAQYVDLLKYVVLRNTQHHFADVFPWGWLVPVVAAIPLFSKRLRGVAILLWVQVAGWLALVALNGQVRWQNERYTMAAVAWLLVLAAMGLATILGGGSPANEGEGDDATLRARLVLGGRTLVAAAIISVFWWHQIPNMRDQIWFFGRASRNIQDQHLVAGKVLAELGAHRVLVGDAGALMYASDRSGLDIIGLGGYHDFPFARAGVHGLGASLELIERMPPSERPDVMAIYPSWWGDLPTLFGDRITQVPVVGNVICGGSEKVIYRADWSTLDATPEPRTMKPSEILVDELDVADLVSEKAHRYVFPHPAMGFVDFRVLADPIQPTRDLFDAGRVIPPDQTETAVMRAPGAGGRLVVRSVVGHRVTIQVHAGGGAVGQLRLDPVAGWTESSLELPANLSPYFQLDLTPSGGDWLDCHVWIVASKSRTAAPARFDR